MAALNSAFQSFASELHSSSSKCLRGSPVSCTGRMQQRRLSVSTTIKAVGWDPEGILAQPRGGHIARRQFQKQVESSKEAADQLEKARQEARAELQAKRDARVQPTTHAGLIEYFLETEAAEMEFEVARCRPLVTSEFIQHLTSEIGRERFATQPNQERLAELQALQEFIEKATADFDSKAQQLTAPLDRMKKLLTAKDKKQMLLDMAGNNEIDKPLLDLLQQNIDAARSVGQEEPAQFMEKIQAAARKFIMSS